MSKATAQVHFAIVDGELEVSAPLALEPLNDFFETEIGTSDAMLDLVEHHVSHDRTWQFAGDCCHLDLDGETISIKHSYTGSSVHLARADLRTLLADLRALLAEHYG